jgi:hypothetical protein
VVRLPGNAPAGGRRSAGPAGCGESVPPLEFCEICWLTCACINFGYVSWV